MTLLLNENAPIDAALFLLKAAVVVGLLLVGGVKYLARRQPATRLVAPPAPGSRVPWLVIGPTLAVVAYLFYLLARLVGS